MQYMIEVIAEIIESHLLRVGALKALGQRFEPSRPDSNNQSHRMVPQPVFFFAHILTAIVAVKCRQRCLIER